MTHEQIRERLSAQERTPEVTGHLEACEECRAWAETLTAIRGAAPQMFTDAPAGLATAVLDAVRAQPAVAAPNVVEFPLWRRLGARAGIAAALAAIVAAGVLIPRDDAPMVAVAARKTTDARTARFELTTSFELRPARPIPLPRPNDAQVRASIKANLPTGVPSSVRRALSQAADRLTSSAPRPITSITSSARGRGEIEFPGRMHFSATVSENNGVTSQRGKTETIVIDGRVWLRTALFGDRWVEQPRFGGDIAFDFHPGDVIGRMGAYDGDSTDLGIETRNGARVRHYRYTDTRDYGSLLGVRTVTVDTWIGVDDGLVHEMVEVHTSDGAQGRVRSREHVRFFDFGANVSVKAPPAEQRTAIAKVAAGFYGFGFGMAGGSFSFDFEAAATMPDFSFPQIRLPEIDLDIRLPDFTLPDIKLPDIEIELPDLPSFP